MKIENKITTIQKGNATPPEFLDYLDLIKIVANTPLPQGLLGTEMIARLDLIKKCDEGNDDFNSEETKQIKLMCSQHRWGIVSADIADFTRYIASLPEA